DVNQPAGNVDQPVAGNVNVVASAPIAVVMCVGSRTNDGIAIHYNKLVKDGRCSAILNFTVEALVGPRAVRGVVGHHARPSIEPVGPPMFKQMFKQMDHLKIHSLVSNSS
ncbi:hypothetical protein A2U01_0040596, partial [Trifolium medium]|nr:hypothetical protein [Trifolium medium]